MDTIAHDIIMEALDLMGQEVQVLTQNAHSGSVLMSWGTITGVSEKNGRADVLFDGFRVVRDDAIARVNGIEISAHDIIDITEI